MVSLILYQLPVALPINAVQMGHTAVETKAALKGIETVCYYIILGSQLLTCLQDIY